MGFRLFGPLQAHGPGGPVLLTSRAQRAVLAMLLLEPGRPVRPERLTGRGLPATPPDETAASPDGTVASRDGTVASRDGTVVSPDGTVAGLDATVAELQRALAAAGAPGILVPEADGYRLEVDPRDVDAERFAAHARDGRRALADGEPAAAADHLEAALAEWVGEPLAEFAGEPFAGRVIADLENVHAEAVQDRAEARLALGDVDWCVAELARLVSEMPYRERLWELYATALCRAGRTADALDALQRVRNLLDEELGLAPGPRLLALETEIRQNAP